VSGDLKSGNRKQPQRPYQNNQSTMSTGLYVGNLCCNTTSDELQDLFSKTGFAEATFIQDRETGTSRGFAFVMMSWEEEARNATAPLNGRDFQARNLMVNEAEASPTFGGAVDIGSPLVTCCAWRIVTTRPALSSGHADNA
jgi:RNA recognition motif-containing protein